jgi:hypothetical protein
MLPFLKSYNKKSQYVTMPLSIQQNLEKENITAYIKNGMSKPPSNSSSFLAISIISMLSMSFICLVIYTIMQQEVLTFLLSISNTMQE